MSCMWRTNVTVPAGVFVHVNAGDTCSPACVYFAGIWPPSGNAVVVNVMGRGAGPPAAGCCAWAAIAVVTSMARISNQSMRRIFNLQGREQCRACLERSTIVNSQLPNSNAQADLGSWELGLGR